MNRRQVVFPDVHDPLVLERAFQLRDSLEAMMGDKEDIVAIVPRFIGRPLVAPLQDAGYRCGLTTIFLQNDEHVLRCSSFVDGAQTPCA